MNNSTYSRRSQIVSTVKQVAGHDPGRLLAQECSPGRGHRPWRPVQSMTAGEEAS
jgi:hypothetical protein